MKTEPADVRFGSEADMCSAKRSCPLYPNSGHSPSFDQLIGAGSGMVSPSVFAIFRLIASSYLVGACTGMSAGFVAQSADGVVLI